MSAYHKIILCRVLFAAFTALVLAVTYYIPAVGIGYALDSSHSFASRAGAVLFVLPSAALLLFLVGLLPPVRGRLLGWLGIVASFLLLPSAAVAAWHGAGVGTFAAAIYVTVWWLLVRSKIIPSLPATAVANDGSGPPL